MVSLAVLADDEPAWRPCAYETATAGCGLRFEFPIFKVLDFADAEGVFARTGNPFALVIAAHQLALATKRDPKVRYERRFRLWRRMYELGLERQRIRELWNVIHTLTRLPRDLELKFKREVANLPGMTTKDLVTPWDEIAMEEAHQRDILDALEARFGSVPEDVCARVKQIFGVDRLRQVLRLAVLEPSLGQFLAKL